MVVQVGRGCFFFLEREVGSGGVWCMRCVSPFRVMVNEDGDRVVVMGVSVWRSMVIVPLMCV